MRAGGLEDADLRADSNTTFSSDDNILLDGIANNEDALGFFGFAYYITNTDAVRAVAIQNEAGECVLPSDATVQDGSYNPLSRPLFIYVNNASARENPQVAAFVQYYLAEGAALVMGDVGYSLPPDGTFEAGLDALDSLLSSDLRAHTALPGFPAGLEGAKAVHRLALAGMPDVHSVIEELIAEGDRVMARYTLTGTHKGDFFGMPPTGKQVRMSGVYIVRIADGLIVEHWGLNDEAALLRQLGVLP